MVTTTSIVNSLSIQKAASLLPHNIQIDPEFQSLIPPLSESELSQLEANLVESGCIDPLIVLHGTNTLLDGHNRYFICTQRQIPYSVVEIDLPSRDAALAWIANHQLGRRNATPEVASYLRGKCYLHQKGNRSDNLKQYSLKSKSCISVEDTDVPNCNNCISVEDTDVPNCKSCISVEDINVPNCNNCTSVNTAKILAEQYKVGERTIHNDARFASAVDTLEEALGTPVKHQILSRDTKLTKKDVLSIASAARNSGKEVAKTIFSNKLNKTDIVEQIKNKQRVPNPHYKHQICKVIARGDKDLKKIANCWCIIIQVNEHTCNIQTWKEDIPTVKPENLKPLDGVDETLAAQNFYRIRQLADKVYVDYDPMHVGAVEALAFLPDPSRLTPKQERMLQFLEKEYGL